MAETPEEQARTPATKFKGATVKKAPSPKIEVKRYIRVDHHHEPKNVNEVHKAEKTKFNDRVADSVTRYIGTMACAYLFAMIGIGSLVGVVTNNLVLALVCGAVSSYFIQLVLLPVIMVSQRNAERKDELKAEEQYKTTLKMYHDAEETANHIAHVENIVIQIAEALIKS